MKKFFDRLEKLEHVDLILWLILLIVGIIAFVVGSAHYAKTNRNVETITQSIGHNVDNDDLPSWISIETESFSVEIRNNQPYLLWSGELIKLDLKDHKPIAEKPYSITRHNHSAVIFKNGKKIGSFTIYKEIFQLTDLKTI